MFWGFSAFILYRTVKEKRDREKSANDPGWNRTRVAVVVTQRPTIRPWQCQMTYVFTGGVAAISKKDPQFLGVKQTRGTR